MKGNRRNAAIGAAAVLGGFLGAGVVLAASLSLKTVVYSNPWGQTGYGVVGTESYDGTFIVERFGQRNGVVDTGAEHPALWVRSDMNNTASGLRASSGNGVDAYIGGPLPAGAAPAFGADGIPTILVGDGHFGGKLNTNGQKNGATLVNYVAIEGRGAIKLCGKSSPGDPECTNQAYVYLEDESGNLVVKFGNGVTKTVATAP